MNPRLTTLRTIALVCLAAGTARADAVIDWNNIWLDCIRATGGPPCPIARAGAMVHAAIYQAVNSIDRSCEPYLAALPAPEFASQPAAAAVAAHDVLAALYPARLDIFDAALAAQLGQLPAGASTDAGVRLGHAAASQILAARQNDGSEDVTPYPVGSAPGDWRPTPPDFRDPASPNWGHVKTWTMIRGDQFRPAGPFGLGDMHALLASRDYARAFRDVKELGARNSTRRTPYQTQTAYFWANDVDGTYKPPGHLNVMAQVLSAQKHNSLRENARLFALLNIALGDAGIVAWDCKYVTAIDLWRPVTGIREADTDDNPWTVADPGWEPLNAFTPPFPAYVSGHATFAGVAAAILAGFYHTDRVRFTLDTDEPLYTGGPRTYRNLSSAAIENARSRIFLGVHWQCDAEDGYRAGTALGEYVFSRFLRPVRGRGEPCVKGPRDPKNPEPGIAFAASGSARAPRWTILDVRGRLVATLSGGLEDASVMRWDGRDSRGGRVANGVYFARREADPVSPVHKILILK